MTHTLTGNDIAAALFAVEETIAALKKRGRANKLVAAELRRLEPVRLKLQAIFDHAYPCTVPDGLGKEGIMIENGFVTRQTRAACFKVSEEPAPAPKRRARANV